MIKKAVFPVAGMGTRFLPATKANPKEMLPIVDKPLIQYAVEEAVEAGIEEIIFVTSSSKRAIEDHFDSNYELEAKLAKQGREDLLSLVQNILPKGVSCSYIRQPEALGLGHAVLCAEPIINDEPFAVLLADDLIDSEKQGCLAQMIEVFKQKESVVAVQKVSSDQIHRYGVVGMDGNSSLEKINTIIEKPFADKAPSDLGVVGRYILSPKIFEHLKRVQAGTGGEIQLTDAIAELLKTDTVNAFQFDGKRYDCGSKIGYFEATVAFALAHPEIGDAAKEIIGKF